MYFILFILLVCFIVGLFTVYGLSNDDFVMLRKNISLDTVFNNAFLVFFVGMFVSRFFFVLFHFDKAYLNPLVFLFIPRFPGIFVICGIVGAIIFMQLVFRFRKIYFPRLFDFYALGLLSAFGIGYILSVLSPFKLLVHPLMTGVVLLVVLSILISIFRKNKLKDGSVGLLSLGGICTALIINSAINSKFKLSFLSPDVILSVGIVILCLILFFQK